MRLAILVDATAPDATHEAVQGALRTWRQLAPVDHDVVVFGERASFVPADQDWRRASVYRAVASGRRPDLAAGLALVADRVDGVVLVLHTEPEDGWDAAAGTVLATLTSGRVPEAIGSGRLGVRYDLAHLLLVLQWARVELGDRQPGEARIRLGRRVVPLFEGQRLWPHHLGRALDFTSPLATVVRHPDGTRLGLRNDGRMPWSTPKTSCPPGKSLTLRQGLAFTLDGVEARVRMGAAPEVDGFRPSRIVADPKSCSACREPLGWFGNLTEPPDPRVFCRSCAAGDRCSLCGAPMGDRRHRWPDGREICHTCYSTAILDHADLVQLSSWARAWLSDTLAMHTPDVPLTFADPRTIAKLNATRFIGGEPATRGLGMYRYQARDLWLEHGLSRNLAFGALVHEWTHVWQFENWPGPWHIVPMEGLAMWTEVHALRQLGAEVDAVRAEAMGGVYGLGLLLYRQLETEVGFSAVPRQDPRIFFS
jgi:hypothetical protein